MQGLYSIYSEISPDAHRMAQYVNILVEIHTVGLVTIKTKHTFFFKWLTEPDVEKAGKSSLTQVLKHQLEKQLNQVQGNRLVISSNLKFCIKTLR